MSTVASISLARLPARPVLELRAGLSLAARYRLERELASGSMGQVWIAVDRRLDRRVAVKLLAQEWQHDRVRFEQEARALARVHSPHVVEIHDFGRHRGCPYYVMELLEGVDLRTHLKRVRRIAPDLAEKILVQAAEGLAAAHAAAIIHRGVEPANLFLVSFRLEQRGQQRHALDALDALGDVDPYAAEEPSPTLEEEITP
jgi:serine/threonine protein kinase